ncbi:MAG: sodium:proton antiporter NhaD [Bacteroidales bacterium]|nr:sodium:proton antiporter NhaD [Bacteroidales bacterium]
MFILMIVLFVVGYVLIALEHPIKVSKSATALFLGIILWVCAAIGGEQLLVDPSSLREFLMNHPGSEFKEWLVDSKLVTSLGEVSSIVFFLLGAMIIVELVDTQEGFRIITDRIKATKKVSLLWIISILTFFLSSVLDNMTTAIIMVALLRKLIGDKKERWFFASMVILAANAGGAWSPIGDVTTIMLWVAGKVSTLNIMEMTFMASLASILVPLIILSFIIKGEIQRPDLVENTIENQSTPQWQRTLFLCLGVGALLFTPVFKSLTGLPPYLAILGGVSVLWVISEIVHRKDKGDIKQRYAVTTVIKRVDVASILFFLGILMAVNALTTVGHLGLLATNLDTINLPEPEKYYLINVIIGLLSSVVDNVPLVAAGMGMYSFPMDHYFWEMLAYCAGTGGSILIIGSAAGVAVMGMEKIDFIWYLKRISGIALIGYLAGAGAFIGEKAIRKHFEDNKKEQTVEVIHSQENAGNLLSENIYLIP